MAADGTWASAGGHTGANLANAAAGDTVDLKDFNLTITNNGAASDTAGVLNTFTLGAITNTGAGAAGSITTTAPAAAGGDLSVTIASVSSNNRNMTVQNTNASAKNTSETVTGTTTLGTGTLAVTNNEATNNESVSLTLTGNLVSATSATVTGAAGSGGSGSSSTLTLNGAANAVTTITLDDSTANSRGIATLAVNGAALTVTNINGAAAGEGTVTLASGVTITGAVGAGTRIGTLNATSGNDTISGNLSATNLNLGSNTLTLTAGSLSGAAAGTISTTIASTSTFGHVVQTGAADNSAQTTAAVTVAGYIPNGSTYKLVDGNGTGAPTAPTTVTSTSPNVRFAASLTGTDDILLTATRTATAATTGNTTNVATTINNIGTPTGDMSTVLGRIDSLTSASAVNSAYSSLTPVVNEGVTSSSIMNVDASLGTVMTHLDNVRMESNMTTAHKTGVSTGDPEVGQAIWAKGFGNYSDQNNRGGINGYTADVWGTAIGYDSAINDMTRLGGSFSYAYDDINTRGGLSGTTADSYQGTFYGTYNADQYYIDGAFSFAWNSYDSSREIVFPGLDRIANGSYDGQQYTVYFDGGWPIEEQGFTLTPIVSLEYMHLALDKYTETGAGDLNLAVKGQDYDVLQSGLGGKISSSTQVNWGKLSYEGHAKWLYDFIGDKQQTTSTFTGGGASFSTTGVKPAQNSVDLGASITLLNHENVSFELGYDCELKSGFNGHSGTLTVRYAF